jgi:transcriptional regulator with XRE-family HTH domain
VPFVLDDIGNRLRAFRLGSGLGAEEIARRVGISRTALYQIEKGGVNKIETLERLSELLGVSVATLLGVGVEYIGSAVSYFERMRQIEETAEHITVLAGPISFLLASDTFEATLDAVLRESIPDGLPNRQRAIADVEQIMAILHARKRTFRERRPSVVNIISAVDIERFLLGGFVGKSTLPEPVLRERRLLASREIEYFASVIEQERIGIQVGIARDILPHAGFQLFRHADRKVLTISPFRLGEQPNVRVGMAMITSAPDAIALQERTVQDMWQSAIKGPAAARFLRELIAFHGAQPVPGRSGRSKSK